MMIFQWQSSDEERRKLSIELATVRRALVAQKKARDDIEKKLDDLDRRFKHQDKYIKELEKDRDHWKKVADKFKKMLFKSNQPTDAEPEEIIDIPKFNKKKKSQKPKGGQKGHPGHHRKQPDLIDIIKRIFLTTCPKCGHLVNRAKKAVPHVVEDIPSFEEKKTETIRFDIEEQWCPCCKKKVKAVPYEVIPKCQLGINLILYIMILKYGQRASLDGIVFALKTVYGVTISKGGIVNILHRSKKYLGPKYQEILNNIRGAPVKHADETSWRIDGKNKWTWGFFTPTDAYYTIEETRGKGIPQAILKDPLENQVLVRDDYSGYKKLPLQHQSCWAHLLRNSLEAATDSKASDEIKILHESLKDMFDKLHLIVEMPFKKQQRQNFYVHFKSEIENMIVTQYQHEDTKSIQTRIRNQSTNLITALIHKNVPLTNNLAERSLRPLVVIRKISGGSRSPEGAKTLAVNMSIFHTIQLQQKPLIPTLKKYLLHSNSLN